MNRYLFQTFSARNHSRRIFGLLYYFFRYCNGGNLYTSFCYCKIVTSRVSVRFDNLNEYKSLRQRDTIGSKAYTSNHSLCSRQYPSGKYPFNITRSATSLYKTIIYNFLIQKCKGVGILLMSFMLNFHSYSRHLWHCTRQFVNSVSASNSIGVCTFICSRRVTNLFFCFVRGLLRTGVIRLRYCFHNLNVHSPYKRHKTGCR